MKSNQIEVNSPAWKLSGMEHSSGHSEEYWIEKTGVNPAGFPEYFQRKSGYHGFGYSVTDKFRRDYQIVTEYKQSMFAMLTA